MSILAHIAAVVLAASVLTATMPERAPEPPKNPWGNCHIERDTILVCP